MFPIIVGEVKGAIPPQEVMKLPALCSGYCVLSGFNVVEQAQYPRRWDLPLVNRFVSPFYEYMMDDPSLLSSEINLPYFSFLWRRTHTFNWLLFDSLYLTV